MRAAVRRFGPGFLLLALAACADETVYEGAFDMPVAAAVLQPEVGGPFEQPVGFVANGVGGNIIPLDLKNGRFLTVRPTASFLRTSWLPTGEARALGDVAAYAPSVDEVTLFAADRAFATLLRVPFIVGLDEEGFPIDGWIDDDGEIRTEPRVVGLSSMVEGNARIEDIELKRGYTSTEVWTVTFEPVRQTWIVRGSRSGLQENHVVPGERFVGDQRRIAFTLTGQGQPGDVFEIATDNGVDELDVGGTPVDLAMAPDQSVLALTVGETGGDGTALRLFDPASEAVTVTVPLAADARPGRLAWAPDGGSLFVADAVRPAFWEVSPDGATVIEHVLPFPTTDVAPLFGLEFGRLVYVVPLDGEAVWLYDLDALALRDVNAAVPGVQGMPFESPVLGIEAISRPHLFREVDADGVRRSGQSVAVSLHEGKVVFMEQGTGCLLQDVLGPRTVIESAIGTLTDVETNFVDEETPTFPFLQLNSTDDRHVVVNQCAGIAQDEAWLLRFDRNLAAWVVEGGVSGVQDALAFEDERYLSDRGDISFVVRAGSIPSEDGWEMTFIVEDGVLEADGDNDGDGIREVRLDVPADPVFFHYLVGPGGVAWEAIDERSFVLVPAQASDVVARVDPQEGDVDVWWD